VGPGQHRVGLQTGQPKGITGAGEDDPGSRFVTTAAAAVMARAGSSACAWWGTRTDQAAGRTGRIGGGVGDQAEQAEVPAVRL
jgi:hypothetical protein